MFPVEKKAHTGGMDREAARTLGIQALGFLAEHPDLMNRFLQLSGFEANDLRAASRHLSFFASLLDFLLADERTLLSFADHAGLDPSRVAVARHVLAGAAS